MNGFRTVELSRDCPAVQIPAGTPAILPSGTPVDITQELGGSFTVRAQGLLFRISGADADALGIESKSLMEAVSEPPQQTEGPADENAIWETLKTCFDPEIPLNIVDLGLVYDLHIEPLPSGRSRVGVKMTLTAPGCGMGEVIARDVQEKVLYLPGVEEAEVELVWDPPWHQSMISSEGRKRLGLE